MSEKTTAAKLAVHLDDLGVQYFSASELLTLGAEHANPASEGYGQNTICPDALLHKLAAVARQADRVRIAYKAPLRVISGYRSGAYNRTLSGAAVRSYHLLAMALDLSPLSGSSKSLHKVAISLWNLGHIKGGLRLYSWGVHIDLGPRRRF